MATFDYSRFANSGERLLTRFGELCVFKQLRDSADGDESSIEEPWNNSNSVFVNHDKTKIAFLPDDRDNRESSNYSRRSKVPKGNTLAFMGRTSFIPTLKDLIYRKSLDRTYSIETISVYQPSEQEAVLYVMRLI